MRFETALALYATMSLEQRKAVMSVFAGIIGAFNDVRDAFVAAVTDEAYVIETEIALLATCPAAEMVQ